MKLLTPPFTVVARDQLNEGRSMALPTAPLVPQPLLGGAARDDRTPRGARGGCNTPPHTL